MQASPRQSLVSWIVVVMASVTLALVVANVVLLTNNQALQAEVNQRQQFINQSVSLSRINAALIRELEAAAISSKDEKLRDMLTAQGITVSPAPGGAASSPGGAATAPAGAKEP